MSERDDMIEALRLTAENYGPCAWTKTHFGERPLNKAEAHRLAHKLRDPKFYTARTKRAVNSLTVERGPNGGAS